MKLRHVFIFGGVFLFSSFVLLNKDENDTRIEKLTKAIDDFNESYPQQKVYLHFDKPSYNVGENIWFKAYLVDGSTHLPDKLSTNLYIEFINSDKKVFTTKRLLVKKGFATGDFTLSDTLPQGLYQIRAYTNWMNNFDPKYFFTKNISVSNSKFSNFISPKEARNNKKILSKREKLVDDIDFQFFPEGGDLVIGITSTVAFKAINKFGKGVDVEGAIFNSDKKEIVVFNSIHNGMGLFRFQPEKDKKYYGVIKYHDKSIKVDVPRALDFGTVLHINDSDEKYIHVELVSNQFRTDDNFANEIVIIGQMREKIYYKSIQNLSDNSAKFSIDKGIFPTGILQVTAFTSRLTPVAERLVFINHHDNILFNIETSNNSVYDKTNLTVKVKDSNGNPVASNFSLAIVDGDKTIEKGFNSNIVSYLLLTSDLKGFIEDPLYYFKENSPQTNQALDILMLTHGWRRFDWTSILNNEFPEVEHHVEKGITIDGKITREFFGIPLPNCEVTLTVMDKYNDAFTQLSDEKGEFVFEKLIYFDSVNVKIEAFRPSGRKNLVIELPKTTPEPVFNFIGDYDLTTISTRNNKIYRRAELAKLRKEMREKEKEENERNKVNSIYGKADNVIISDEISEGYSNILQVLQGRVPGVLVSGNSVVIRGVRTIYGSNEPLYLIDGVPMNDVSSIMSIPVSDVDRIEILKGSSASIFGSRGANGVIAIYTKRGEFMKKGVIEFEMLGYSRPRKFYQPKFSEVDIPNDKQKPTTLYWNPIIQTNSDGEAKVALELPAYSNGTYYLIVEGITYDGKVGSISARL